MIWSGLAPELVWGLLPRFVGLLYIIAFGALSFQLISIIGERGVGPIRSRLDAARRDFPGIRRFFDFPTIFWLSASDRTIRLVPMLGILAGAMGCCGGWIGWTGLLLGWFLWLSVEPAGLIFPWDTMLQEAGFLALFLPLGKLLPSLEASALPLPTVAFMCRWLVLRLMLGFAKVKFIGTGKGDSLYLRGFLIWAPLPTPIAWWAHHSPQWILRASLWFMFFGEAIAPVLGFFTGLPRLISFAVMSGLMVGIHVTGNWGYFNIGFIMLSVCLLDLDASIFDVAREPWAGHAWEGGNAFVNGAMIVLFVNSLVYAIVMNSWVTRTWVHWLWETVTWNRPWARWLISYFRALAPFHFTNGYGVFPPYSAPPLRLAPVIEGSMDGKEWKAYGYKYLPTTATGKLPIVAPHHPRFDQALHYCAIGIHDGSFFNSLIGDGTPYLGYLRTSWLERVSQRLLLNDEDAKGEFGSVPFPDQPPKLIRVSAYALAPTRIEEYKQSGQRWRVRRIGTMVNARGIQPWVEEQAVPQPELFHVDFVHYKKRAQPLREMVHAHATGQAPDQAVLAASDLTAEEVARFWSEFVPAVNEHRGDWARVSEHALALQERFGAVAIYRFERLLMRFSWLLRMHTEDHFVRGLAPKIELLSNWRYEMLLQEIIVDGRDAYLEVLKQPSHAAERATRTTDETQLWTLAMVRYDMMIFHIRTFRWNMIGDHGHKYKIHGIFEYVPLLSKILPPDEEWRPMPHKHDD
ncbi:MAG: symbB, partial [Myxococcaceae bacterium]|nr:symbB [Myxococcaceae bacterium]